MLKLTIAKFDHLLMNTLRSSLLYDFVQTIFMMFPTSGHTEGLLHTHEMTESLGSGVLCLIG